MLLKGFILMFKRENVRMAGADGGLRLKWREALEGILKFIYD
mgnify:CR=1 FL=1